MINAICSELRSRSKELSEEEVNTVYFGGGTPSVLDSIELKAILNTVAENYNLRENVEITLEANPDDIDSELLMVWKSQGVNRLSIGIQSFRDQDLTWMNRSHTAEQSKSAVISAQNAGFDNITIDLIYGLPNMRVDEWEEQIDQALALNVPHISAYCLTVEPNTVLAHLTKTGKIATPGDQIQSEEFLLLRNKLKEAGFLQYEVSNFARPGFESRHNSAYWKNDPYLGVGPSAHSYNGLNRRWNVSNNQQYMQAIESGEDYFEVEQLTVEDRFNEMLLTGLRTVYGVEINELKKIKAFSSRFLRHIDEFKQKGWLEQKNGTYYLTTEGLLFADHIASELFEV